MSKDFNFLSRQKAHAISKQVEVLQELDEKVRNLIVAVSNGQPSVEEIRSLTITSTTTINQHTTNEFEKDRNRQSTIDYQRRLLESLYFPEMNSRQEQIKEAHKKTFNWLFDETGEDLRPWSNYTEWLRTGQGTYWISGKAGSGKSTLMNMLYDDERTMNYLKLWAESRQLLTTNFFFWKAGTELQRTHLGLLRSLLYQLLSAILETTNHLPTITGIKPQILQAIPAWTEKRLSTAILESIAYCSSFRICIFIDGLDEFTGDQNTLLSWIGTFSKSSHIKLCLSSRPLLRYEEKLGSSAMLRLQDLTRADIEAYASAKLGDAEYSASSTEQPSDWIQGAVKTIVNRAEGVFIWVELAVKNQLEGLYNQDNHRQLQERLDLFPTELEVVYSNMIHRIDKVHRREVALYLRMAMHGKNLLLRQVALAALDGLDELLKLYPNHSAVNLSDLCNSTRRRIMATCKDLLEVHVTPQGSDKRSNLSNGATPASPTVRIHSQNLSLCKVGFVHRTVVEFLQENETGRSFINDADLDIAGIDIMFVKVDLAALLLDDGGGPSVWSLDDLNRPCTEVDLDNRLADGLQDILMDLCRCEEAHGRVFVCLTERIDFILSSPQYWRCTRVNDTHRMLYRLEPWDKLTVSDYEIKSSESLGKFVPIAACYGLHMYVLHKLDTLPTLQQLAVGTHLLKCVCLRARLRFATGHARLATSLLQRGVSANTKGEHKTVFAEFLTSRYRDMFLLLLSYGRFNMIVRSEEEIPQKDLFLAFLHRGVDVHQTVPWSLHKVEYSDLTFPRSPYTLRVARLQFRFSPLTVVRHLMGNCGDSLAIEQAFIGQGASERSVCTSMELKRTMGSPKGRMISFQLSAQQSARITYAWDRVVTTSWRGPLEVMWPKEPPFRLEVLGVAQELYDEQDWQES